MTPAAEPSPGEPDAGRPERGGVHQILAAVAVVLPQPLKHWVYRRVFGWSIDPSVRIGLSYVSVGHLTAQRGVVIGHGNVIKGADLVTMGVGSRIGAFNWISGAGSASHLHTHERDPSLRMGREVGITRRHLIDVSDRVRLDDFSVLGGSGTQILTHEPDLMAGHQRTAPVEVGPYSVVFTGCIITAGARVPARCAVGAGAVVTKPLEEEDCLYAGSPVRAVKRFGPEARFFHRERGDMADRRDLG